MHHAPFDTNRKVDGTEGLASFPRWRGGITKDMTNGFFDQLLSWAGKIGELAAENTLGMAITTKPWLAEILGWQGQEFYGRLRKVFTVDVLHDRPCLNFHISWGMKPMQSTTDCT
jgi:hypothetical protein